MTEPQTTPDGRPPWTKVVGFVAGLALVGFEATVPDEPRTLMVGVAVLMMGLAGADLIDRWFGPRK